AEGWMHESEGVEKPVFSESIASVPMLEASCYELEERVHVFSPFGPEFFDAPWAIGGRNFPYGAGEEKENPQEQECSADHRAKSTSHQAKGSPLERLLRAAQGRSRTESLGKSTPLLDAMNNRAKDKWEDARVGATVPFLAASPPPASGTERL